MKHLPIDTVRAVIAAGGWIDRGVQEKPATCYTYTLVDYIGVTVGSVAYADFVGLLWQGAIVFIGQIGTRGNHVDRHKQSQKSQTELT